MATLASFHSSSHLPWSTSRRRRPSLLPPSVHLLSTGYPRKLRSRVFACSASSFDDLNSAGKSRSTRSSSKSLLSNLIQDIEPLDVTLIQKDVPATTVDAMKRTISGMLGLLPSNQFQVVIEALWEPLSKLLVSSMMTGYTLRNAEYRLCLEKNLEICEGSIERQKQERTESYVEIHSSDKNKRSGETESPTTSEKVPEISSEEIGIQGLGDMTPEAQQYILRLQSRLSLVKKELHEAKRKTAALQMQQFVGEEKNDLLDYLRSLQPEKVVELSEPTSAELKETIHLVVHGLLATLSPKMHSKSPPLSDNTTAGAVNTVKEVVEKEEDCAELLENTSLNFQPHISLTRDYLARLLFWCMLLGHYLRGLEYRVELMELLTLSNNAENSNNAGEQAS